jgi:Transcriptional regulator, AbiEi antitoxin, Type IV TA system/Transcriptional regulator, AbiEi antitoxin N-terminal domain
LLLFARWLDRLGQGVNAFAGDTLSAQGAIQLLQTRVAGLQVAGKSALALHGGRHNLAPCEVQVLWGDVRFVLPMWFTSRFPSRYVSATLFNLPEGTLASKSLTTPAGVTDGLRVSVPEPAVLEVLYEVGTHQGLEEARNLFNGLRNLCKEGQGELLQRGTSVKTIRLSLTWDANPTRST